MIQNIVRRFLGKAPRVKTAEFPPPATYDWEALREHPKEDSCRGRIQRIIYELRASWDIATNLQELQSTRDFQIHHIKALARELHEEVSGQSDLLNSPHLHSKTLCGKCGGVIIQCKCSNPDKHVHIGICDECKKEAVTPNYSWGFPRR